MAMLCDCFKRPSANTATGDEPSPTAASAALPPTHRRLYEEIYRLQSNVGVALGPRPTPTNIAAPAPKHLVRLNVYHLIDEATNAKLLRYGFGVFHTGVIVYGIEWSFGESVEGQETGLFCVAPGNAAGVVFKTIDLGYTDLSPEQVDTLLHRLENEWKSADYHVLNRNCNHFAERFCRLLSTLERLEIPAWCNRSARWSDKIVPKSLATWVLRRMDGCEAPPMATTVGTRSQIGELPLSVVPLNWYKTAALRRDRRFAIQIPSARPAAPRREPAPTRGDNAALLGTGHLQATPPPPGKADVSSPDVAMTRRSDHRLRQGPPLSQEAFGTASPIVPPVSRGAVKMPDFNKHLTNGASRPQASTTTSGNVGSERLQLAATASGGVGDSSNGADRNPVASFSAFQNSRVGDGHATSVPSEMHDLIRQAAPVHPAGAQATLAEATPGSSDVAVVEESPVFHGDVELDALNDYDEGGEIPTLLAESSKQLTEARDCAGGEATDEPPVLARSGGGISPLALTADAVQTGPRSPDHTPTTTLPLGAADAMMSAVGGASDRFDQQCRDDDASFLSVNVVAGPSTAADLLDDAAALGLSAEHIPLAELSMLQTDGRDDDEVQGHLLGSAVANNDDDMTLQNIETELHAVQLAEGHDAHSPPHHAGLLGVTRTASFTRPSVASVYSTPSGSPHSTMEGDNDTIGGMRTEDATVFTEAVEQRCR